MDDLSRCSLSIHSDIARRRGVVGFSAPMNLKGLKCLMSQKASMSHIDDVHTLLTWEAIQHVASVPSSEISTLYSEVSSPSMVTQAENLSS